MENKILKGEGFLNRYRITGKLRTLSPLHIGTGEESDTIYSENDRSKLKERLDKIPTVSTVIKDIRGKPLIPGSSLRGVMRHWLLNVLRDVSQEWAATRDYEHEDLINLTQEQQIETVKKFSWLEVLFGTPFHEGKIELWDANCLTESLSISDRLLNWNSQSLTYIDTSVAIDPETGTALDKLLYKTEIVPPGVEFEFNLVGQNLTELELGLILLALQGFNSKIYPIRVGARGGRGYGRVQFLPGPIFCLRKDEVKAWLKDVLNNYGSVDNSESADIKAGYFALPELDEAGQRELTSKVKTRLIKELGD